MSREVFFLSIMYPHSSTECTCYCGFSDMVMTFLQYSPQQAPECALQQISALSLRWWLLKPPPLLGTDKSNQRKSFGPASLQQPWATAHSTLEQPEVQTGHLAWDSSLLSAARTLVEERHHHWRLCVNVHAHISLCMPISVS